MEKITPTEHMAKCRKYLQHSSEWE